MYKDVIVNLIEFVTNKFSSVKNKETNIRYDVNHAVSNIVIFNKTYQFKSIYYILGLLSILVLCCSCSESSVFKKSANNRLLDMNGFKKEKRRPLYNSKYIAQAKKNIALDQDCCDDEECEDTEFKVPSKVYKHMYMEMLADEYGRKKDKLKYYSPENDLSLNKASNRVKNLAVPTTSELKQEITEIKTLLRQAKSDLVRYRCKQNNSPDDFKELSKDFNHKSEEIIAPREEILHVKPAAHNALQQKFLPIHTKKIVEQRINIPASMSNETYVDDKKQELRTSDTRKVTNDQNSNSEYVDSKKETTNVSHKEQSFIRGIHIPKKVDLTEPDTKTIEKPTKEKPITHRSLIRPEDNI